MRSVGKRRFSRSFLALLCPLALIAGPGSYSGIAAADDGPPRGMVAFFSGTRCPEGWIAADYLNGRAAVAVIEDDHVGIANGAPSLAAGKGAVHQHRISIYWNIRKNGIVAASAFLGVRQNKSGAQSGNRRHGQTISTHASDGGLPLIRSLGCEKL